MTLKFANVLLGAESVKWMKTEHIARDFLGWLVCCWFWEVFVGFLVVVVLFFISFRVFYVKIGFRCFLKLVLVVY